MAQPINPLLKRIYIHAVCLKGIVDSLYTYSICQLYVLHIGFIGFIEQSIVLVYKTFL